MVYEIIMYMFACDRKIRKWAIKSLFIVEKMGMSGTHLYTWYKWYMCTK